MNTVFQLFRLRAVAVIAGACLMGVPVFAKAGEHDGQSCQIVNFSWESVPAYIVHLGNNIASRARRAIEPESSSQYQEPRARYADQQSDRSNSMEAAVQLALARIGYYNGRIDGNIGPRSRRAIARYQEDRGPRVTGYPDDSLLNSLGLL